MTSTPYWWRKSSCGKRPLIAKLQPRIGAYEAEYRAMVPEKRRKNPKVQDYCRARAAAQATLERAETIINELEADIKVRLPRVGHINIEVEGIVAPPLEETAAYLFDTQA
jgi:hypothetical protein